jgi:hypothetical protein
MSVVELQAKLVGSIEPPCSVLQAHDASVHAAFEKLLMQYVAALKVGTRKSSIDVSRLSIEQRYAMMESIAARM